MDRDLLGIDAIPLAPEDDVCANGGRSSCRLVRQLLRCSLQQLPPAS
jgi:hypothetical protein